MILLNTHTLQQKGNKMSLPKVWNNRKKQQQTTTPFGLILSGPLCMIFLKI
jgi:hypothetical protein